MQSRNLILGLIIAALGAAVSVGLVAWAVIHSPSFDKFEARIDLEMAARKLDQRLEEAEKAGVPLTRADLALYENTPADLALGAKLDSLGSYLRPKTKQTPPLDHIRTAVNRKDYDKANSLLKPINSDLDALSGLLRGGRIPLEDLDFGYLANFETIRHARTVALVLGARSRLRSAEHDLKGALADVETISLLQRRLQSVPLISAGSSATSALSQSLNSLNVAIYEFRASPEAQEKISAVLLELSPPPEPTGSLDSEIYLGIASLRNDELYNRYDTKQDLLKAHPGAPERLKRSGKPGQVWPRANLAQYLGMVTAMKKAQRTKDGKRDLARRIDQIYRRWARSGPENTFIRDFWFDDFQAMSNGSALLRARQACMTALLQVLEHKQKTGTLPVTLSEVGFTARDPFSNKPYGYKVEGQGFRIYSVGSDGKDNGGVSSRELRRKGVDKPKDFDDPIGFPPIP